MQNRLLDFYLLCSSSYKIVTNDLQTLQLPYKQRDWVVNHRHLIHRPKSSMLDSHKPWLIRLCSPTLLVAPCTDLLCKWTRLVLENPISSWPQSHRHSLFHYFVHTEREREREREREIWDILFFFFFWVWVWVWVWKGKVMGGWFEGSFLLFFPFFLIFLLGLFCLLLMTISIYSSAKGIDPTIWKIWSHGFSCSCSTGKWRKKEK